MYSTMINIVISLAVISFSKISCYLLVSHLHWLSLVAFSYPFLLRVNKTPGFPTASLYTSHLRWKTLERKLGLFVKKSDCWLKWRNITCSCPPASRLSDGSPEFPDDSRWCHGLPEHSGKSKESVALPLTNCFLSRPSSKQWQMRSKAPVLKFPEWMSGKSAAYQSFTSWDVLQAGQLLMV